VQQQVEKNHPFILGGIHLSLLGSLVSWSSVSWYDDIIGWQHSNLAVHTILVCKDENGTEISRTDRFRFLYYDSVFKHKKLSVLIGFTTIFNHFIFFNC
jgi:hypothetical protein